MEVLYTLIFVQSIVWLSVLLRKTKNLSLYLIFSFLSIFALFLLKYLNHIYELNIPEIITIILVLINIALLNLFHSNFLAYKHRKVYRISKKVFAVLLLIPTLILFITKDESMWYGVLIYASFAIVDEGITLLNKIKEYTHSTGLMENPKYRLTILLFNSKLVVFIFSYILLYFLDANLHPSITIAYYSVIAIAIFIVGYITNITNLNPPRKQNIPTIIIDDKEKILIEKIETLLENTKPYLDCDLSLEEMSDMLEISDAELTKILNEEMQTNFYQIINKYRIKEVIRRFEAPSSRKFTILSIAYESGFNSKSTFYRVFKEHTGETPSKYIEELRGL